VIEDPYVDPATGVLRNLRGIRDRDELAAVEREQSTAALYRLGVLRLPGRYDLDHLRAFHGAIFGNLYPWAGRLRTVAIDGP
jgi:cell filamentation protein